MTSHNPITTEARAIPLTVQGHIDRPETLTGKTVQVNPVGADHCLFVTVNSAIINQGMPDEYSRPVEVLINTQDADSFAYLRFTAAALTSIFRSGNDYLHIIDEMIETFDPKGGYFIGGGEYANSVIAHVGLVIKKIIAK